MRFKSLKIMVIILTIY